MATSSKQVSLFGIQDWKTIYQTFRQADFASYDYETLRKSFVDYLQIHYPENFNDYVESSEFVAILDIIAFMGQSLAFRNDLNTRENFIDTAERRDSVLKLARLVGYNAKRNYAAQGFLKITALQTTENIADPTGLNLSRVPILWDDTANPNWQLQFNTVLNGCLTNAQKIGRPGNSLAIDGIRTDEYGISISSSSTTVFPFTSLVDNTNMDFELVSMTSLNKSFLYENAPTTGGTFNILFRNDRKGNASADTGFFIYFKQGKLNTIDLLFDQQLSNRIYDFEVEGVNQDDTWLVQFSDEGSKEWSRVENIYASNNPQTILIEKKIFAVESRFNDQVSYNFGDGVFGEIPVGIFRAYMRASNSLTYNISPAEMQNIIVNIPYISRSGREETLSMSLSLQTTVNNALSRESLDEIREKAPVRYYTQNRMVNGEDYSNLVFTNYGSIVKSKAVNRSSSGISRNTDLLDPTGKYSSLNIFGDDGALYSVTGTSSASLSINNTYDLSEFFSSTLLQVMSDPGMLQNYTQNSVRYSLKDDSQSVIPVTWNNLSTSGSDSSGYFSIGLASLPVGSFSSRNLKYVSPGCLIKIEAPSGYIFDANNKLISGVNNLAGKRSYWASVVNVIGDGNNFGAGALDNGFGPVTVTGSISTGAVITEVIPAFTSSLSTAIIQQSMQLMNLQQSFSLVFDNSKLVTQERFTVVNYPNANSLLDFISKGGNRYEIRNKTVRYYFGSANQTRFAFTTDKKVFDPKTGKIMQDHILVLKTNSLYNSSSTLDQDLKLNIIGQQLEIDGYPDDYAVEVTSEIVNGTLPDPEFFTMITGSSISSTDIGKYTFFKRVIDMTDSIRSRIIETNSISYQYPNLTQIELAKYEFPAGQIFYAHADNKFYVSKRDSTANNIITLVEDTSYSAKPGRQGLHFQYKHISNSTTRVDPATSNIIDLYIVTKSHYIEYVNWLNDTTNAIVEPEPPTLTELSNLYGSINEYKMISDNLVFSSVKFKPLFGKKAEKSLQSTIKVIKSATTKASDSEIRTRVLGAINQYFSLDFWDFGDTFYFSELSAFIHSRLNDYVSSVILVPNDTTLAFGTLYEVKSAPNEIFTNAATINDIVVISSLSSAELTIY